MTFYHPKYYKELRKRNKLDQAISNPRATAGDGSVRPDPGPKPQASSAKLTETQAASDKPQAPSRKRQAPSRKLQADES